MHWGNQNISIFAFIGVVCNQACNISKVCLYYYNGGDFDNIVIEHTTIYFFSSILSIQYCNL